MTPRQPKRKRCAVCRAEYAPRSSMQRVCSPVCALALVERDKARAERKRQAAERTADRVERERQKTFPELVKEAQREFNRYIRLRDAGLPCICCGVQMGPGKRGGAIDAGHYRSRGSAPHLRFHEDNCHAQRKHCNRFRAGRAVDYRKRLIKRIGIERVEALEADQTARHWTRDDLRQIRDTYRAKARALSKASQTHEDTTDADTDAKEVCPA